MSKFTLGMGATLRLAGSRKYSEGNRVSKASKKTQQRDRKGRRMGRAERKAEMKGEQKPLARANKFRAVN